MSLCAIAATALPLLLLAAGITLPSHGAGQPHAAGALAQHAGGSPGHVHSDRATASHSFADVEQWSKVFDDPKRDAWQRPQELVAALSVQPGQTVADLGAGTGYFVGYLAGATGPDGTVLAVDVEPTLIEHLRRRAEKADLSNVVPVLASLDNPRLPVGGVDLIFIADTFHHFDHRARYLPLLRRALKAGGRVAVIDWKPGELPEGPPPDHKLAPEQVVTEMRTAGFVLEQQLDLLPHQYVLIFRPATR